MEKKTVIGLINNEDGQPHVYIAYEGDEAPLLAFTPEQAIETATIMIAYARQVTPPIVYGATKPLFPAPEPNDQLIPGSVTDPESLDIDLTDHPKEAA